MAIDFTLKVHIAEHHRPHDVGGGESLRSVAQASLQAMRAQPTKTPADISFNFFVLMVSLLWSALQWRDIATGRKPSRREQCRAGEGLAWR